MSTRCCQSAEQAPTGSGAPQGPDHSGGVGACRGKAGDAASYRVAHAGAPAAPPSAWRKEWKALAIGLAVFGGLWFLPTGEAWFERSLGAALGLVKWYAREHVVLCLVPAFFIAGAITAFTSRTAVMRTMGPNAPKALAYAAASVSGALLAVCSCTVLPLFASIRRMGAGLGPACAFLYSGPAVNVLAVVLTASVLGPGLGVARGVGAVAFSVVIGVAMHVIYRKRETVITTEQNETLADVPTRSGGRHLWLLGAMVGVLVFANWGEPASGSGLWQYVWSAKWLITGVCAALLGMVLVKGYGVGWWKLALVGAATAVAGFAGGATAAFGAATVGLVAALSFGQRRDETNEWVNQSWGFAKQITPLLLAGVLVSGFLLGRPGEAGLVPSEWVAGLVGGNSLWANLCAAMIGSLMYFATLTEVPIVQGLVGNGMGEGPALALLLAGPAVSLPNLLVIRSVLGTGRTAVFALLVVALSTLGGWVYGMCV